MMNFLPYFAFIFPVVYLLIIGGILLLINTWVNRSVNARKEQNALLREIVQKLDKED